jgi:CBS domain-containing membrane protein
MTAPSDGLGPGFGVELTDEDCYDAMRRIPGYLDISLEDFREVYRLALDHAVERLMGGLRARDLMAPQLLALSPDLPLDQAVRDLAGHRLKGAPVVDGSERVIGMLSETDLLRHLGVGTWLGLLVRHLDGDAVFDRCCHDGRVRDLMTAPSVCVAADAGIQEILAAFRAHPGRRMPVVDAVGRLLGMLARKDLLGRLGSQ